MLYSQTNRKIGAIALGLFALAAMCLSLSYAGVASADAPVFLTRQGGVISTYPNNVAFAIGTSTATGQVATTTVGKLNITLRPSDAFLGAARDGFRTAFQIASTTTSGGTATSTADILTVSNTAKLTLSNALGTSSIAVGCVQSNPTSTATTIKQIYGTVATTSGNGFVLWSYGTCP